MNDSGGYGLGFGTSLTLLFIVLKLTGVIDWSWFWVLSPILISIGLIMFVVIIMAAVVLYFERKAK